MTLSRLEPGFESPWGRHQNSKRTTPLNVEARREAPRIKGSRFFIAHWISLYRGGNVSTKFVYVHSTRGKSRVYVTSELA